MFAHGRTLKVLALTWLIGNTVADLLITAAMLYHCTKRRNVGDRYFSNHALSRIVRLTIETNVLTSIVGVIALLMVSIFPDKNWFTCPTAIIGKLYSNTLLVSLNNRIALREVQSARGVVRRSRAMTVPSSRVTSGATYVLEKFRRTSKGRTESGEYEGQERVIDIS